MADQFSARDALRGYLYQCRFALLESVRRLKSEDAFTCRIELLDDVDYQTGDTVDLFQLKLHADGRATTDHSADIWKTLRVWANHVRLAPAVSGGLYFVTNSTVDQDSALSRLRPNNREEAFARVLLEGVAQSATSQTTRPGREAFLSLSPDEREALLGRIVVLDGQVDFTGLDAELDMEFNLTVPRRVLVSAYRERVEGWWLGQVVSILKGNREGVTSDELDWYLRDLVQQFQEDNLPIDSQIAQASVELSAYENYPFVYQLDIIDLRDSRILRAARDYYRASAQRSLWLADLIVTPDELNRYERKLREEWEIRFDQMEQELGSDASEDLKKREARSLFSWVEAEADIRLRERCDEGFLVRGSYHVLANRLSVGWHADFQSLLAGTLGVALDELDG